MELQANSVIVTANGASGAVDGAWPEEPKWTDSGMSASSSAENSGSQWSVWKDGRPSGTGFSGKVTVRAPLAAVRSTSATHAWTSHRGSMTIGTNRSGAAAHHSSSM